MRKFVGLCALGFLLCGSTAQARDEGPILRLISNNPLFAPSLTLTQDQAPMTVPPSPEMQPVPYSESEPISLYHCVRYKDLRNIAPCAVPMIVQVKDPCACRNPCSCCQPACVNVKICVPPCGCPEIKYKRGGSYVKYDYGEYEVEIRSRRGRITVDYDD